MNKSRFKLPLLFVVALMFQMVAGPLHFSAEEASALDTSAPSWVVPVDYVALGDSLAVGVTPNNELGEGYTDYLAQSMHSIGALKSFNKGFSFPGYTSGDIAKDLQENVTKGVFGSGYNVEKVQLHQSIADAEVITISAGANDVLPLVKIDSATGIATVDQQAMATAIQQVALNYKLILKQINNLNPDAQVYVMGYYNPYPYMAAEIQPFLEQLLNSLNKGIELGLTGSTAKFVPTGEVIATDHLAHVPNPHNIHLSELGYQKVQDQFWTQMLTANPWIPANSLVAESGEIDSVNLTWQPATDNRAVTSYEIYNGREHIATVNGDVTAYKIENLAENTAHIFSVVAVDQAGNKSIYNPVVTVTTMDTAKLLFTDIENNGLKLYIEQAAMNGIIGGYPDGTFKPNQNLTRVQAAAILVRALKLETNEAAPFGDINGYAEQTKAEINAAYKYGIIKGDKGNFKPSEEVTRAQLALMIERASKIVTGKAYTAAKKAPYTDLENYNAEAVNAISMLHELNIATGFQGEFMPSSPTTRAQAAKIVVNFTTMLKPVQQ